MVWELDSRIGIHCLGRGVRGLLGEILVRTPTVTWLTLQTHMKILVKMRGFAATFLQDGPMDDSFDAADFKSSLEELKMQNKQPLGDDEVVQGASQLQQAMLDLEKQLVEKHQQLMNKELAAADQAFQQAKEELAGVAYGI